LPDIDLSDTSKQVSTCQTTVPFRCVLHAAVPKLRDLLQVMLLSDGSVTRHLQLLTDLPVQVVSLCSMSHKQRAMHGIVLLQAYIWQQSCHMRIPIVVGGTLVC